ncbi:hypothetical protein LQW54_000788 [Pestalotiopsis sp. IQ-011]
MTSSLIRLVPWDQDSPDHVERLGQQRIACGWKVEKVPDWKRFQRDGKLAFYWITLAPEHAERAHLLEQHWKEFPVEQKPLQNSCTQLMGSEYTADLATFHPVGHICLDGCVENHADNSLMISPEDGVYALAAFYISTALQGSGIGREAMTLFEETAVAVHNATTITLDTLSNEDTCVGSPRMIALGRPVPKVPIVDWYQRRGYVVYDVVKDGVFDVDSTGKRWNSTLLYMKKDLTAGS